MNCRRCGAPGADQATYAGVLCAACAADLVREAPRCDFCLGSPVGWAFPCDDFESIEGLGHWCRGDWLACGACRVLVDEGAWGAVADRAVQRPEPGLSRAERRAVALALYRRFAARRRGPARELGEGGAA